ncbi:MAG: hypothetical protein HC876_01835 [Chloroflexaceae bacterium]|nr:hypothetical protein [Chloroflexaceae bacterium]
MMIETIQKLYDYNYWANALLLEKAAEVDPAQLKATTAYSFGSLFGTLVHTMSAEWMWRLRMQEGRSPERLHTGDDFAGLQGIRDFWGVEEGQMRAFLSGLSDDALMQPIFYTNTNGQMQRNLLWESLQHLVLHGMQHRSEIAIMLTDYGHSPGWIDFIRYVREQQG